MQNEHNKGRQNNSSLHLCQAYMHAFMHRQGKHTYAFFSFSTVRITLQKGGKLNNTSLNLSEKQICLWDSVILGWIIDLCFSCTLSPTYVSKKQMHTLISCYRGRWRGYHTSLHGVALWNITSYSNMIIHCITHTHLTTQTGKLHGSEVSCAGLCYCAVWLVR